MRFVIRLWLPDRPGALGRVASAIGSVGASLVGIDILEQQGGFAIDELIVEAVEAPNAIEKLVAALTLVESVNVEDIRATGTQVSDPRVDALETAAEVVEQENVLTLMRLLTDRARHDMSADWAALVHLDGDDESVVTGDVPSDAWMRAFLAGSRTSNVLVGVEIGPDDIAWAELAKAELALVVGRDGRPFRGRERLQLGALCRIADRRLAELPR